MNTIYFDNNATTRVDEAVLREMLPYFYSTYGNPSSTLNRYGVAAENAVQESKAILRDFFNADSTEDFIFTSGATEANNMAIRGIVFSRRAQNPHIIVSAIEHASIMSVCRELKKQGIECTYVPVNTNGEIMLDSLEKSIKKNTILISVMYANNEIGTIQPIEEIGNIAHKAGIVFHTDATQYIYSHRIDMKRLHIDMLSFSAHKIHGPKGIGILYANRSVRRILNPLIYGGHQQDGLRGGTLNVPGIVGLSKAISILKESGETDALRMRMLQNEMLEKLRKNSQVQLNGDEKKRIPNNLNLTFQNISAVRLAAKMPEVAFSVQSACASSNGISHVLKAIGLSENQMKNTIRIGLSKYTTHDEIIFTANKINEVLKEI